MSIETLPRTTEMINGDTSSTPLLDSIVPPSESVKVKSTRAMLLRLGETAASVRMADSSETDDALTDAGAIEDHLKHSLGLFLRDIEQAEAGVIFDQEGEVVNSGKLLDELAEATRERAREARLNELNAQLAQQRAEVEATEAEIARLMGAGASDVRLIDAGEAVSSVVEFSGAQTRHRRFGAMTLSSLMVGLRR